jgi:hypothetical protein
MRATFYPHSSLDEMCQRAVRDIRAYRHALPHDKEDTWKTWAGAQLNAMMNSRDTTAQYLADAHPSLRLAAVSLVAEYWRSDEYFVAPCLRLAFDDPVSVIRGAAIVCLMHGLHSYVDDASGLFGKLMAYLRNCEPIPCELVHAVQKEANDAIAEMHEQGLAELRQLADGHLEDMRQSVAAAVTYLDHPNMNLRRAALLALYEYWKADFDLRGACMRIIRYDRDLVVRKEAQNILSTICYHTNDSEVVQLLTQMVRDTSEPIELRKNAYLALFIVRPMPVNRILQVTTPGFQFPEDVDWTFVSTQTVNDVNHNFGAVP